MPMKKRGKMSRMYSQDEYDGAMSKVSMSQARRKMAGHYNMTQKAFNGHMAGYKAAAPPPAGKKPLSVGSGTRKARNQRSSTRKKKPY